MASRDSEVGNATPPPRNDWQQPMKGIGKTGEPVPQEYLRMSKAEWERVVREVEIMAAMESKKRG